MHGPHPQGGASPALRDRGAVSTSSNTPLGTSQITITASSPGGPDKTQLLTLTVGATPDYGLVVTNPSLTTHVNSSAVFNGTLTSINSYTNPVNLSCGVVAPPSCVASPARHSAAVNFSALPAQSFDFTLSATPPTVSVSAGKQTALYCVDVSPTTDTFPGNVSFSCSTLPVLTTCAFQSDASAVGEWRLGRHAHDFDDCSYPAIG
jgi:hypothetical protein